MELDKEIMGLVSRNVTWFAYGKLRYLLNFYEVDDLSHEVYVKMLKFQALEKYDPGKIPIKNYILIIVKRTMIDLCRKIKNRYRETSFNVQVNETELIETIPDKSVPSCEMMAYATYLENSSKTNKKYKQQSLF